MQPGDGAFHDPASGAEAGAVGCAASGDDGGDAAGADLVAVAVVVVAPIGIQPVGAPPWWSWSAADRGDGVEQGGGLRGVVPVPAGQCDREGNAAGVGDDVVFRARFAAVDRARTGFGPPLSARMCEPSITALDMSSCPVPRSRARSSSCSRCHTPAWFQSRNLRQQVIPDPKPNSWGRYSHGIAV